MNDWARVRVAKVDRHDRAEAAVEEARCELEVGVGRQAGIIDAVDAHRETRSGRPARATFRRHDGTAG